MNSVKLLIKASVLNSFSLNRLFKEPSKTEKTKMIFIGIIILLAFSTVFSGMLAYFFMISDYLLKLNALNIILSITLINISAVSLLMSVYKASGYLYSFKDYDLLMSLPVKTSEVLVSKLSLLYGTNLIICVIIGVPSLLAYGIKSSSGIVYYAFAFIAMVFVSLIPMSVGALLSLALGKISTKFRSTNIVMIIGSFLLVLALMVGSYFMNNVSAERVQNSAILIGDMAQLYFPTRFFVHALENLNTVSLLIFILISVLPFILLVLLFSRSFKTINSKMNERYKAASYKMTSLKVSSVLQALYKKEINFYFSSYIYVLNTSMGSVMMTIVTIGIAMFGGENMAQMLEIPMVNEFIVPAATAVISLCVCLTCTTAPSISLEGKNLWIVKSLPINPIDMIKSKILVNLIIILPILFINTVILAVSLKMTLISYIAFLFTATLYAFYISLAGIIINLYLPKLEWKSHMVVVKQSASVIVAMLAGAVMVLIPILIYILIKPVSFNLFQILLIICLTIINLLLWLTIKGVGIKSWRQIH